MGWGKEEGEEVGGGRRTLALFFEGQFALLVVVFVLAAASVFATLEGQSVSLVFLPLWNSRVAMVSMSVPGSECM